MVALLDALLEAVANRPGLTGAELTRTLRDAGWDVDKSAVNRVLYGKSWFSEVGGEKPRWVLSSAAISARTKASVRSGVEVPRQRAPHAVPAAYKLRQWQVDALAEWSVADDRGVVEAVTGTGKTLVGIEAMQREIALGGQTLVLVPTIELQNQWCIQIAKYLPAADVGRIGADAPSPAPSCDVVVALVQSVIAPDGLAATRRVTLVIADETHRYGSRSWSAALLPTAQRRLGLTATYERNDDGRQKYLDPYFGGCVFSYDYADAKRDDVIAPFIVALVGIALSGPERTEYNDIQQEMSSILAKITSHLDRRKPLLEEIARLAGENTRIGWKAKRYLGQRANRLKLLARSAGKREVMRSLAPLLRDSKTLVFTEHKESADSIAQHLCALGVATRSIHSGLHKDERNSRLEQFKTGALVAVVAPRVLDEGIDIPIADLAIVLSATLTKRQMIQRMGRVLRKVDGKTARFVLVYAKDTVEDPSTDAHEGFLDMTRDAASAFAVFPTVNDDLHDFLRQASRRTAAPVDTPHAFPPTVVEIDRGPSATKPEPAQPITAALMPAPARLTAAASPAQPTTRLTYDVLPAVPGPRARRWAFWRRRPVVSTQPTRRVAATAILPVNASAKEPAITELLWEPNWQSSSAATEYRCSCGRRPDSSGHCGCS